MSERERERHKTSMEQEMGNKAHALMERVQARVQGKRERERAIEKERKMRQ